MIKIIVLSLTSLLIVGIIFSFISSVIHKEEFIGKSTIPGPFFLLAKITAFTCVGMLIPYGLNVNLNVLFTLPAFIHYFALGLFLVGLAISSITSSTLKKDLKFGLPKEGMNALQTKGIYSWSRHPFYIGFLLVMLSSVILIPSVINIICFIIGWLLHHFIMIGEEKFLLSKYGAEYEEYMKKVNRYF
jgi:protein-S-isoprenylcysteine O-methyltransferase Ste14